ncbi:MAG: hypothetical protein H0W44_09025 [Gammaproteobacteria bacterium]|nr:hypothetical protein [Gammaproteobacteria bacterium]
MRISLVFIVLLLAACSSDPKKEPLPVYMSAQAAAPVRYPPGVKAVETQSTYNIPAIDEVVQQKPYHPADLVEPPILAELQIELSKPEDTTLVPDDKELTKPVKVKEDENN